MTLENPFPWADHIDCAVTVCDTEGMVLYQNERSCAVNGDVRGQSLLPCHNQHSLGIIRRLLAKGGSNTYTIEKRGVRKLIHQTVWYQGDGAALTAEGRDEKAAPATAAGACEVAPPTTPRGAIGGLVEFSIELPPQMPHYVRS